MSISSLQTATQQAHFAGRPTATIDALKKEKAALGVSTSLPDVPTGTRLGANQVYDLRMAMKKEAALNTTA